MSKIFKVVQAFEDFSVGKVIIFKEGSEFSEEELSKKIKNFSYKIKCTSLKRRLKQIISGEVTEAEVTEAEVTEAEVTEAEVTEAEVTEAEVTEAEVTEAESVEGNIETTNDLMFLVNENYKIKNKIVLKKDEQKSLNELLDIFDQDKIGALIKDKIIMEIKVVSVEARIE